ncbi:MAG: IS21-like element helper ATPase IstB [Desulfovermiculus sp.]|jgi:DNA replication protein DnaC|nr:IS21-like element helper ATPase IstB [Desulfovermiculus sp.]
MKDRKNICESVKEYAASLRLSSIQKSFEHAARRAESESLSYEHYLCELLREEYEQRWNRRVQRYLRESRLNLEKNMDTFEMKRLPPKVSRRVDILLEGDFLRRQENILAFGNPGSGKTHLLSAIAQELIHRGHRIYFTTCSMLVQKLLQAKRDLELERILKKLRRFEAVFIDDFGYIQQSREEMDVLFTLLAEWYERRSIMITSNLPFSKWQDIFKDPMTTAAAIDRLVHHSVVLELNLSSYRAEEAREQQKSKSA